MALVVGCPNPLKNSGIQLPDVEHNPLDTVPTPFDETVWRIARFPTAGEVLNAKGRVILLHPSHNVVDISIAHVPADQLDEPLLYVLRHLALGDVEELAMGVALLGTDLPVLLHESFPGVEVTHPFEDGAIVVSPMPRLRPVNLELVLAREEHPVGRAVHVLDDRDLGAVVERESLEATGVLLGISVPALLSEQIEVRTTDSEVSEDGRRPLSALGSDRVAHLDHQTLGQRTKCTTIVEVGRGPLALRSRVQTMQRERVINDEREARRLTSVVALTEHTCGERSSKRCREGHRQTVDIGDRQCQADGGSVADSQYIDQLVDLEVLSVVNGVGNRSRCVGHRCQQTDAVAVGHPIRVLGDVVFKEVHLVVET